MPPPKSLLDLMPLPGQKMKSVVVSEPPVDQPFVEKTNVPSPLKPPTPLGAVVQASLMKWRCSRLILCWALPSLSFLKRMRLQKFPLRSRSHLLRSWWISLGLTWLWLILRRLHRLRSLLRLASAAQSEIPSSALVGDQAEQGRGT